MAPAPCIPLAEFSASLCCDNRFLSFCFPRKCELRDDRDYLLHISASHATTYPSNKVNIHLIHQRSFYLPVICLCIQHLSIHPTTMISSVHPTIYPFNHPSSQPASHQSSHPSIHPFIYLSSTYTFNIYPFVQPTIHPSL